MNLTFGHLRLPLGLLAVAVVACGSATDDAGSAESGVTVTPTGDDHPGQLVVTVPAGVTPSANDVFTADGTPIVFGTPVTLSIGDHALQDRHCWGSQCGVSRLGFPIQNHATTTVSLGAIGFKRSGSGGLLGVDAALSIGALQIGVEDALTATVSSGDSWVVKDTAASVGYRLPMTYDYAFGLFDGFETTVEAGKVDTIDLDGKTNRRQVRIVAPARSLPDAKECAGWEIVAYRGTTHVATNGGFLTTVPAGTTILVGERITSGVGPATYTMQMGPIDRSPGALTLGEVGGDPATLNVGRVDVANVAVKQNDGTTIKVIGSYTLSRVTTSSAGDETVTAVCASTTNSGVDVLPGKYRLVTTYETAETGEKTTTNDVTIP